MPEPRRRAHAAGLLCLMLLMGLPIAATPMEEYENAITAIRCDCGCHPQTVKDCACGRAAQMREEVAALIEGRGGAAPMTGAAVIAKYVAEQGEQILISPSALGFNLFAWIGPIIALVLGLGVAIIVVRRVAARHESLPAPVHAGPPVEEDANYRERLRRQLAEWD